MGNIALGLNSLTNIKFGDNQVSSVYLGTNLVWSSSSYSYILNLYPTSIHHAYSLRKLSSTYSGKCLRIRRTTSTPSVTTTTVDLSFDTNNTISLDSTITFVSGTATTATNLGQFCASILNGYSNPDGVNTNQSIFVVTWLDQSGNNKNTTQATAGNQPRLINDGNLETSGGKVAVRFIRASSTRLTIADTTANINNMSSYFVGAYVTTGTGNVGYSLGSVNRFYLPSSNGTNVYAGYGTSGIAMLLETITTNRRLYELIAPTTGSTTLAQGWLNGIAKASVTLINASNTDITLGVGATFYYDGYIQEVIGWQSNTNRPEKETEINSYWQIY